LGTPGDPTVAAVAEQRQGGLNVFQGLWQRFFFFKWGEHSMNSLGFYHEEHGTELSGRTWENMMKMEKILFVQGL